MTRMKRCGTLGRAREDAVVVGTQAKYRLKAFLLRQGRRYPGREGWTLPYRRWLTDVSFPSAAQHIALQEYRDAIAETEQRIDRLTEQLRQLAPTCGGRLWWMRSKPYAGSPSSPPWAWSPNSGTSPAFGIRASSWRISGSCRLTTRVGPRCCAGTVAKAG